jgi:hypothetical protein
MQQEIISSIGRPIQEIELLTRFVLGCPAGLKLAFDKNGNLAPILGSWTAVRDNQAVCLFAATIVSANTHMTTTTTTGENYAKQT